MKEFWQICVEYLKKDIPIQQAIAWVRPLVPISYDENKAILRVLAPNRFKLELARKRFSHQIETFATEWFGKPVQVHFELPSNNRSNSNISSKSFHKNQVVSNNLKHASKNGKLKSKEQLSKFCLESSAENIEIGNFFSVKNASKNIYKRSQLNTKLTFENFVTGKANQLAQAAAFQVAKSPGISYNPLFLYGEVGLGKTHLMHSIGNAMLNLEQNKRVRYVHADQYISDVVKAYQRKTFENFKNYYHSLDLLLIDDIQFFSGKTRTQEEFFYAFEAMLSQHKQIIISGNTYPKELSGIDVRLISRFDSGLTVAIERPELEMRIEILIHKARLEGLFMTDEVALFIARHLKNNIRELEGALHRVLAYTRFHSCNDNLTVETCKNALKDLLSVSSEPTTVESIQKVVSDFYGIKTTDMHSKRRTSNIALPRQIAMYLAKELTQKSLPEIGKMFGGRDHTTVLYAVKKISNTRHENDHIARSLNILEQTLKG